jgi:multidrug resistance protein
VVFLTVFLDLLGFGIIIPIQPFYAEAYGASPTVVTLLGGSYSLMQFLFVPFWGRLSDRIGRRPVMLVSIAASIVGYTLFGLADSLWLLFAARMLTGFGNANIATAQAIIADVTPPSERARGMGLIGAAFGLGFIVGPALGGAFGQISVAAPAYAAAVLSAVNWIFAWRMLPETLDPAHAQHEGERRAPLSLAALRKAMENRQATVLVLLVLAVTVAFSLMEQVLGLYIERHWVEGSVAAAGDRHSEAYREAAWLTTQLLIVIGIVATIVQGGLIGRLVRRHGERNLAWMGLGLLALGLAAIPAVPLIGPFWPMFLVVTVLALGSALTTPTLNSLLSRSTSAQTQGSAMSAGQSMSALGRVIGPAFAGLLFEVAYSVPFLVSAALMVLCLLYALRLRQPAS